MISKIRKYQDSWLTKAILALTALSFMSLFGISGYVNRAGKNRAVIKVDNMEILQFIVHFILQYIGLVVLVVCLVYVKLL